MGCWESFRIFSNRAKIFSQPGQFLVCSVVLPNIPSALDKVVGVGTASGKSANKKACKASAQEEEKDGGGAGGKRPHDAEERVEGTQNVEQMQSGTSLRQS